MILVLFVDVRKAALPRDRWLEVEEFSSFQLDSTRIHVVLDFSCRDDSGGVLVYDWTDLNGNGTLWTDANGNGVVNAGEIDSEEYNRYTYGFDRGTRVHVMAGFKF